MGDDPATTMNTMEASQGENDASEDSGAAEPEATEASGYWNTKTINFHVYLIN